MNSFELFEFQDYLAKEDFKKVEYTFVTQCLATDFKEFNTSLGSNSKDYLSYLLASSLLDGTIENNKDGHMKFFAVANGYSERFFQNTMHHVYNLSVIQDKKDIFEALVFTAKDFMNNNKKKLKEFKDMQLQDYLTNFIQETEMDSQFYMLTDYDVHYKKLQSYLLQDKLHQELDVNDSIRKSPKI